MRGCSPVRWAILFHSFVSLSAPVLYYGRRGAGVKAYNLLFMGTVFVSNAFCLSGLYKHSFIHDYTDVLIPSSTPTPLWMVSTFTKNVSSTPIKGTSVLAQQKPKITPTVVIVILVSHLFESEPSCVQPIASGAVPLAYGYYGFQGWTLR